MRSPGPLFDLRAALSEEMRAALLELDQPCPSARAVHRCRVRIKRARALARIGRACAPGLSAVFNDSARAAMRSLAQARHLAALADTARGIAAKAGSKTSRALESVALALDAERAALPPIDLDAVRAGLRDALALAQVWPEVSASQVKNGAERIARRARRACKHGRGAKLASRRHEWRKRAKDRLYAALLLDDAWPHDHDRRRKTAEKLADVLGHERDTLLLIDRLETDPLFAGGKRDSQRARAALVRRRKRLARKADALGARLHAGGA